MRIFSFVLLFLLCFTGCQTGKNDSDVGLNNPYDQMVEEWSGVDFIKETNRLLGSRNFLMAAYCIEASIPKLPVEQHGDALLVLGMVWQDLGNYEKAAQYYRIADVEYGYPDAQRALENLEWLQDNIATEPAPRGVDSGEYLAMGWVSYYLQDYPSAIYHFKTVTKQMPDYVMGYMALGMTYDTIGNFKSALKFYLKAVEIEPEYADLWNNIGISYFNLGKEDEAAEAFAEAAGLNPTYANPVSNMGMLHLIGGRHEEALSWFEKALSLNDADPYLGAETCAGLAVCWSLSGDEEKASGFRKAAVRLNVSIKDQNYLKKVLRWPEKLIAVFLQTDL